MDDDKLDALLRSGGPAKTDLARAVRARRAAGHTGTAPPALPRGLVAGFLGLLMALPLLTAQLLPSEAELLGRLAMGDATVLIGALQ